MEHKRMIDIDKNEENIADIMKVIEDYYFQFSINGKFGNPSHFDTYIRTNYPNFDTLSKNKTIKRMIKFVNNGGVYFPSNFKDIVDSNLIPRSSTYDMTIFSAGGVCKTSLIENFVFNEVRTNSYSPVIEDVKTRKLSVNGKEISLDIRDTADQGEYSMFHQLWYDKSDYLMVGTSVAHIYSWKYLNKMTKFIERNATKKPFILVGNKVDMQPRSISISGAIETAKALGVPYIETSTLIPHNVDRAFMLALYWYLLHEEVDMMKRNLPESLLLNVGNSITKQYFYLKSMENQQYVDFYRKLSVMVVGEKGVGKTTFIKNLVGDSWKGDTFASYDISDDEIEDIIDSDDKNNTSNISNDKISSKLLNKNKKLRDKEYKNSYRKNITDGIDINVWKPQGKNIEINLFDFAGQEIYYNTHQFFLCKESIYLLLFNGSKNLNQNRVAYWLHTIISKAPSATLFIISTHFDHQNAEKLHDQHAKELNSIIDNIHFIYPSCKLNIIYPPSNNNNNQNNIIAQPFWGISNRRRKIFTHINQKMTELIHSIVLFAENEIKSRTSNILPTSWINFRTFIKDCVGYIETNDSNIPKKQLENIKKYENLFSRDGLVMINRRDALLIAHSEFNIEKSSFEIFIDLLSNWGEIIVLNNRRKKFHAIVFKPEGLISIFKYFISARKFTLIPSSPSTLSKVNKLKIKLKNSNETKYEHSYPNNNEKKRYLVYKNQVVEKFHQKFPSISEKEINGIVERIISLLIEVRLIYPITQLEYFVPSLLRGKTISSSYSHLIRNFGEIENDEFIQLERRYEFTYLPSGLFTRIMIDICHWKSITDEKIWENGLLIEGQLFDKILIENNNSNSNRGLGDLTSYAILLLEKNHSDISATIRVMVWSRPEYCGELLPNIHRSAVSVIQSLEFENRTRIYCSVHFKDSSYLLYNYNSCLLEINQYNNPNNNNNIERNNNLQERVLRYLIPEFYQLTSDKDHRMNEYLEESRYHCEVKEIQKIGSGASGEVWKGKWFNQLVAIKKPLQLESFEISSIISEIDLLQSLNHPNLLKLLGVYLKPLAIVTELCSFGDLHNLSKSLIFPPFLSLKIISDIADALGYLHNHSPPIIHCDVRMPNIFVKSIQIDDTVCGVLGDVGFSRIADRFDINSGAKSIGNDAYGLVKVSKLLLAKTQQSYQHYRETNQDNEMNLNYIIRMEEEEVKIITNCYNQWVISPDDCNFKEDSAKLSVILSQLRNEFSLYFGNINNTNNNISCRRNDIINSQKLNFNITNHQIAMSLLHNIYNKLYNIVNNIIIDNKISMKTDNNNNNNIQNTMQNISIKKIERPSPRFSLSYHREGGKFNYELNNIQQNLFDCKDKNELLNNVITICREERKSYDNELIQLNNKQELQDIQLNEFRTRGMSNALKMKAIIISINFEKKWKEVCEEVYQILELAFKDNFVTKDFIFKLKEVGFNERIGSKFVNMKLHHYACLYLNNEILKQLFSLYQTFDVNEKTCVTSQSAPIHFICSHSSPHENQVAVLETLYQNGANINLQDFKGETALIKAATSGNYLLLSALLNYDADVNIRSKEGITAVIAAARYSSNTQSSSPLFKNYVNCIKALLQFGSLLDNSIPISHSELMIISQQVKELISDSSSRYARNNHTHQCLLTWCKTKILK